MERFFAILGPLQAGIGDTSVTVTSRKQQLVLARLLLTEGVVAEDELVDVLWSERPPPSALTSLRAHVSRLRASLAGPDGAEVVVHGAGGYRLVARGRIDAQRFEERCVAGHRAARAGDLAQARDELAAGLSLWRGEVLTGFRYEPFAQPSIARLEGLRLQAHEERIALDLELGNVDAVLPELQELTRLHPLRERITELLMQALGLAGRFNDALETYRRARELLRSELGLDPSPALQELHQRLLDGRTGPLTGAAQTMAAASGPRPDSPTTTAWRQVVEGIDLQKVGDQLRTDLLIARADGLRRAGRVDEARSTYTAAARLASATNQEEQLATAVLGLIGPPEDSLTDLPLDEALVERAMLRLPPDHPVLSHLRARLAVALLDRGESDRGHQLIRAALDIAERTGDHHATTYALRARHRVWFDPDELPARLASAERLLAMGRRTGDPDTVAWGHRWCSICLLEGGALEEAAAQLDQLDRLLDTHSDAFHRWFVVSRRAGLRLLLDPTSAADDAVTEALALTDQVRSEYTMFVAGSLLLASHWLRGRWEAFQQLTAAFVTAHPLMVAMQPLAHVKLGETDRAREAFEQLAKDRFATVFDGDRIGVIRLVGLAVFAETAASLGDVENARVLHEMLSPYAGRLAVVPPGVTAVTTVDHCLGRLAAARGNGEAARGHYEDALDQCRRAGAIMLAQQTQDAAGQLGPG